MKYNIYDGLDQNDYELCQSMALADSYEEIFRTDDYYLQLEMDEYTV